MVPVCVRRMVFVWMLIVVCVPFGVEVVMVWVRVTGLAEDGRKNGDAFRL